MNKLIVIGVIIIVLGVIFTAQSQTLIGPTTSFMYNNPDWLTFGLIIASLGIIVIIMGFISRR